MREILTHWTTPAGSGLVNVMYFTDGPATVAAQRNALGLFWAAVADELASTVTYRVAQEGREMSEATGQVTGGWSDVQSYHGAGGSGPTPVGDASQVLLRWLTGTYVAGRQVRGRTFVPGLRYDAMAQGNINPVVVAEFNLEASNLVSADVGLSIWHRPRPDSPGALYPVSSASCWRELAVQRGRRR